MQNLNHLTMMRKQPQSQRGVQRVHKILDAAADLVLQVGYTDLTTNAIAEQAKTSIGSLYQFFENKEAVLEALAARYRADLAAQLDVRFADHAARPLTDVIAELIAGAARFFQAHPAFSVLFFGSTDNAALVEIASHTYNDMVRRVDGFFAVHAPQISTEDRQVHAHLIVSMIKHQLPWLAVKDPALQRPLFGALQHMVRLYVEDVTA